MKALLKTPIFTVAEHEALPSGLKPVVVEAPDWVTVVVRSQGKLLTVKQVRFGTGKMVEEFVCGQVGPGEDPKRAAQRELREETGYSVELDDIVFLGAASPNPAFMDNTMRWYLVDLDQAPAYDVLGLDPDEDEQLEINWVDAAEFTERTFKAALAGGNDVPAMLLAALALAARS